jgi:hypothetical protein
MVVGFTTTYTISAYRGNKLLVYHAIRKTHEKFLELLSNIYAKLIKAILEKFGKDHADGTMQDL